MLQNSTRTQQLTSRGANDLVGRLQRGMSADALEQAFEFFELPSMSIISIESPGDGIVLGKLCDRRT